MIRNAVPIPPPPAMTAQQRARIASEMIAWRSLVGEVADAHAAGWLRSNDREAVRYVLGLAARSLLIGAAAVLSIAWAVS